jgi:class 3 adenylate cyclase/tetratricopeptide (TPR) repeat protein
MLSGRPLPDRDSGAALSFDISGFTALTDDLVAQLGDRRGVDELIGLLNTVYGALIAQVHQYGGSVIGFSGDAITCWFGQWALQQTGGAAGNENEARLLAIRATACALAVQQVMAQFSHIETPSGVTMALRMKAAVAAGPARRFLVGNPAIQYIDVLAGETLDRMASAEKLAGKNEVILDPKTVALLEKMLTIGEWRSGSSDQGDFALVTALNRQVEPASWPEIPANALDPAQARSWLLPQVYARLAGGQGDFLAELRRTNPLFILFEGLNYDADDEAGPKLDAYVRWVQQVLERYGGHLIQFTSGDKGTYLYVSFGAPTTHDDDPLRAVAASLALREPPPELAYIKNIRIGISQGRMRAGPCGSSTRRTYGVLGDEVNMAARLMELALPGQILISQRVAEAVGTRYRLSPLGPTQVRGRTKPLMVFSVIDARTAPPSTSEQPTTTVGREAEQQQLKQLLADFIERQDGRVLIIEGEAGIGKSHLAAKLLFEARQLGLRCLVGSGDAVEKSTPYFAWRPIFRSVLNLGENLRESAPTQDDLLNQAIFLEQPEARRRLPLLNAVLPLELPENEFTRQMRGRVRADNTRELLVQLLQAKAVEGPLVIILEDAHWLDSASWALARQIGQALRPCFLVLVTRPHTGVTVPDYRHIKEAAQTHRMFLDALSPEETLDLVCRRLGVGSLPPPVARLIQEKAEGHPFFSEELALALQEKGFISVQDGVCHLTPYFNDLDTALLPDTVEGVITSRIDNLEPAQQLTLKAASVIGRIFPYLTLQDIHPIPTQRPHLPEHLNVFERQELTLRETPPPNPSYMFKHIITQEVTYNMMVIDQRRQLHRAIGDWYETYYAGDLAPWYPLLAYHWQQANEAAKALLYLEEAGKQALYNGIYQEAVLFFQDAVSLVRSLGEQDARREQEARLRRYLGEAYLGLGQLVESRNNFEAMLQLLGRPAPKTVRGALIQMMGQFLRQFIHRLALSPLGRGWLRPLILRASPESQAAWWSAAHAYEQLAEIYYYANQTILSVNAGLLALNLAERAGPSPELARAYANACLAVGLIPIRPLAEIYNRKANRLANQYHQQTLLAFVLTRTGLYHLVSARWPATNQLMAQAARIAEEFRDWRQLGEGMILQALADYAQGRFANSLEGFQALERLGRRTGNIQHQAWGLNGQAIFHWQSGEPEQAIAKIEQTLPLFTVSTDLVAEIISYEILALAHLRAGNIAQAQEANQTVSDLTAQTPPTPLSAFADYIGVAILNLTLWETGQDQPPQVRAQFARAAKRACRALRFYVWSFSVGQSRIWLMLGLAYWLSGKKKKAHRAWRKSLALAEGMAMPYEQALAHYEIGRHLTEDDPARQQHLERAAALFKQVGAGYDLELLEKMS